MDKLFKQNHLKIQQQQTMLLADIQIQEKKIMSFLQNKLQALQIESLKFVSQELANLTVFDNEMTQQGQLERTKQVFLYVKDAIMRKFNHFHIDVQKVIPLEDKKQSHIAKIKHDIKEFKTQGGLTPDQQALKFLGNILEPPKQKKNKQQGGDFICTQCHKSFENNDRLSKHIVNKHKYSFPCSNCKICFENELVAWIHKRIVHQQFYPHLQCNHCEMRLSDTKAIRRHILCRHYKNVRQEFINQYGREPEIVPEVQIPNEFFSYQKAPCEEGIKKLFPEPKNKIKKIPKQATTTKLKKQKLNQRDYKIFQSDEEESIKIKLSSKNDSSNINEYIDEKSDY